AARGAAAGVKKEVERTDIGKAVDEAGKELVRAAANVVNRIADEVSDLTNPTKPGETQQRQGQPPPPGAPPAKDEEEDEFDGVKPKPREQGKGEPGVRISVDDDEKKKGS